MALDATGNVYVAGTIFSADFPTKNRADAFALPTSADALQPRRRGFDDAFLLRISTGNTPAPNTPRFTQKVYLPLLRWYQIGTSSQVGSRSVRRLAP